MTYIYSVVHVSDNRYPMCIGFATSADKAIEMRETAAKNLHLRIDHIGIRQYEVNKNYWCPFVND